MGGSINVILVAISCNLIGKPALPRELAIWTPPADCELAGTRLQGVHQGVSEGRTFGDHGRIAPVMRPAPLSRGLWGGVEFGNDPPSTVYHSEDSRIYEGVVEMARSSDAHFGAIARG